jgi:hypothetical protein
MGRGGTRDPMGAAESAVLQSITDMAAESQSPDPLRFTAALTNGRWLFMHNGLSAAGIACAGASKP